MNVLIGGLALFVAVHLFPHFRSMRTRICEKIGETEYKVGFSALTLVAFGLIVIGKREAEAVQVWLPPAWLHLYVLPILFIAFFLIASSFVPSNMPRILKHPMLLGVVLLCAAHLLVNSDLPSILIFATFGAFALIDFFLLILRGDKQKIRKYPFGFECMPIAIGGILLIVSFLLHTRLFGVPPGIH